MREEAGVPHQYVRIIGKMQDYEGKPSIIAYSVRKLKSGNELTHHFLEVVYSSEKYKRGSQIVGSPTNNGGGNMMMMGGGGAMGGGFHPGNNQMPSSSTPLGNRSDNANEALRQDIIGFLTGCGNNGRNIREFVAKCISSGKYSERMILDTATAMAEDGIIYTTTDDDYYAYF